MALTTLQVLCEHTGHDFTIAEKIFPYQVEAEEVLRDWIGDPMYERLEANTAHPFFQRAQKAESLLCEMIALPALNRRLTEQGGHVRNLGLDQLGNANLLMGKNELDAYCVNLRHRARLLVRRFILESKDNERPTYLEVFRGS